MNVSIVTAEFVVAYDLDVPEQHAKMNVLPPLIQIINHIKHAEPLLMCLFTNVPDPGHCHHFHVLYIVFQSL